MTQYFVQFTLPPGADQVVLLNMLTTAGLPVTDVQTSSAHPNQVIIVTSADLTAAQQTTMNSTVTGWDARPRTKRSLYAIYNDLVALTAAQQTDVWTDFSSGTPSKYLLDQGPNAAALVVLDWVVKQSGATGAALTGARFRAVAIYVQDNPKYLVNPSFSPSVNVPGDQPVG